jgi:hypothetical protein
VSFKFETNLKDFGNQLERAVHEKARELMERKGREAQALFDAVWESHRGHPVDEVAAEIRRRAAGELDLSDAQVTHYAQGIADGRRVRIEVDTSNLR